MLQAAVPLLKTTVVLAAALARVDGALTGAPGTGGGLSSGAGAAVVAGRAWLCGLRWSSFLSLGRGVLRGYFLIFHEVLVQGFDPWAKGCLKGTI